MKNGKLGKIISGIIASIVLVGGTVTYISLKVMDRLKADGTYNYQLMESTDELLNGSHILIAKTDAPVDNKIKVVGTAGYTSGSSCGFKYKDVTLNDGVITSVTDLFVMTVYKKNNLIYLRNGEPGSNNLIYSGSGGTNGGLKSTGKFNDNYYYDITKTLTGFTFEDHASSSVNPGNMWHDYGTYMSTGTSLDSFNVYIDVDRNLDLWASEYLKKGTVETNSYKEEHFIKAEAKLLQMGQKYINRLNESSAHSETKTLYVEWNSVATKIHSKTYFGIRATKVGESWDILNSEANMMFGGAISKANESNYLKYGVFYCFHDRNFLTNLISVDKSSSTALTSKNIYQYELDLVNVSPVSIECDTKLEWGLNLYDIPSSDYDKQMDAIAYVYTSSSKYLFSNVITKSVKDMANDLISSGTISGNYLEVLNAIVA